MLVKMVMMISMMPAMMVLTMVTIPRSGRGFPRQNLAAREVFVSLLVSASQRRRKPDLISLPGFLGHIEFIRERGTLGWGPPPRRPGGWPRNLVAWMPGGPPPGASSGLLHHFFQTCFSQNFILFGVVEVCPLDVCFSGYFLTLLAGSGKTVNCVK